LKSTRERPTRSTISSNSTATDYCLLAIAYAEDAIADKRGRHYGKWIRLAAKRFIKDLQRCQKPNAPFRFSPGRAEHACRFIEMLPHVEGTWDSATIVLQPFQVFFVVQLFGFRNLSGGRRFTTALFAIARKNAKSTLAAAILLYVFCCEKEAGPQIYSAATTGKQARIVWGIAKQMVQRRGDLRQAFELEPFANAIVRYENGGTFGPINSKASTQDGLNPSALSLDELHAHKTHDLKNVLTSAAGARRNKLFLYTTTEGYETPGPWPEERHFAQQILAGVVEADHYLALIFSVDDKDEAFDEKRWVKANPLLDTNPTLLEAIRTDALEAKRKPGADSEFRIKRLNRRAETASGWINLHKWRRCDARVDVEELIRLQAPCWAGLDLATTLDMAAWARLWKLEDRYFAHVRYWVPAAAVRERTERNTVPYQNWVKAGHIKQTDGDAIDYEVIEADVRADLELCPARSVVVDPWNAQMLANRLLQDGFPIQTFIQGPKSYNPAMMAVEAAYVARRLAHGGNPVLTWNASNLVTRRDANMNMAPDRKRSADRIDGMVALTMAMGAAAAETNDDFDGFLENPVVAA
jgi:phage terminase large subunit-like protein